MESDSSQSFRERGYRRPYNTSGYISKITKKLKKMQSISVNKGDKEFYIKKIEIIKTFIDYLNQFDESLELTESNIYGILRDAKEKKHFWEEDHPEDSEKLQNHLKEFFIGLLKKQNFSNNNDFDSDSEEESHFTTQKRIHFK